MTGELSVMWEPSGAAELSAYVPRRSATVTLRRRRARLLVLVLVAVLALAWWAARSEAAFGGVPASAPERRLTPPTSTYLVQPGDTLWTVARQLQPEGDVRSLVRKLVTLNDGAELEVGQVLVVP